MSDMIDINIIIDEECVEPVVDIRTYKQTQQVDSIVSAIENASRSIYPPIPVTDGGKLSFVSQRDVYRIKTAGRKVSLETDSGTYVVRGTMNRFEEELDTERFIRISQSEIVNLYKVKSFDLSGNGTILIEFENGEKSWVARRCVKALREKLRNEV
ncbi:MAG: LytTR family transcriptional regulator DNA-binding domain-containing protein [Lachnospiraceae bacterium]|nr:LytTR family transcriptional regulator DNA-binding domain-containing protein [Lachnospiraceae bacterium]